MTTLRVVLDDLGPASSEALRDYSLRLTRSLISRAPAKCDVGGIVASADSAGLDVVRSLLPDLGDLEAGRLPSREMRLAWRFGAAASSGLVHSPSLLAPLKKHDRANGDQVSVTVHDLTAWTHPTSVPSASVAWQKAMLSRARKHADAVVVPSHAVGEQLRSIVDFGDRLRVIAGAANVGEIAPDQARTRVEELGLPAGFVLIEGDEAIEASGVVAAIAGVRAANTGLPIVLLAPEIVEPAAEGDATDSVVRIHVSDDRDRAAVISQAAVFVYPSLIDGFGSPVLDAMSLGVPVVHSDATALVELSAGSAVAADSADDYAEGLRNAIERILGDSALADELVVLGKDRAAAFSWRDAADRIWQLHAGSEPPTGHRHFDDGVAA